MFKVKSFEIWRLQKNPKKASHKLVEPTRVSLSEYMHKWSRMEVKTHKVVKE
jgi:hypothetical protein